MREPGKLSWRVLGALAGWAAMARMLGASGVEPALGNRAFLARAVCEGLAGCGWLVWALRRGERMPGRREWGALLLGAATLFFDELLWRPYIDGVLRVHFVRAPLEEMVLLVAPLWLALLAELRLVPDVVPRRLVGATLAGLAAYCLLLQGADLAPRLVEVPALLLCWAAAAWTVWVWSYARGVLAGGQVAVVAGAGLLASAAVHGGAAALMRNDDARWFAWSGVLGPVVLAALVTAVGAWLWYWLLLRVELAVFTLQALVLWLSAVLLEFVMFGFLSWRLDVALLLGTGALVTAVRARVEDEEPVQLHVAGERHVDGRGAGGG